jgi:uncharacterized protein with PQ loop repeat
MSQHVNNNENKSIKALFGEFLESKLGTIFSLVVVVGTIYFVNTRMWIIPLVLSLIALSWLIRGLRSSSRTKNISLRIFYSITIVVSGYLVYMGINTTVDWYKSNAFYQRDKAAIVQFVTSLHLVDKIKDVNSYFTTRDSSASGIKE